jgi:hypothetical protein
MHTYLLVEDDAPLFLPKRRLRARLLMYIDAIPDGPQIGGSFLPTDRRRVE